MPGHPVILEILQHVFHLHKAGKHVGFCWVPGPTSPPGNEAAEAVTKEASVLRNLTSDQLILHLYSLCCSFMMGKHMDTDSGHTLYKYGAPPTAPLGLRRLSSHILGLVACILYMAVY
jgi:hypothetical protein